MLRAAQNTAFALLFVGVATLPCLGSAPEPIRQIRAAIPRHWPPQYTVAADGRPDGFAIDIIEAIAARAGFRIEYQIEDNFHRAVQALRDGEVDLVPNMGILDERENEFLLTRPTETFGVGVFARSDDTGIEAVKDLEGRRLAVVRGNVGAHLLKSDERARLGFKAGELETRVFEDVRGALFELLAGDVDAVIYPEPVIQKLTSDAGLPDRIKLLEGPRIEVKRGVAVRKERPELFREIQRGLDELMLGPEYQAIYVKWYGNKPVFWTLSRVLALAGLATSIAAIGFALVHYRATVDANAKLRAEIVERRRAETSARENESKYRTVMEQAGDAIFVSDDNARIVDVNKIACELSGFTRDELVAMHAAELMVPEDLAVRPLRLADVRAGRPVLLERRLRRKDRTLVPVEVNARKIVEGRHVVIMRDLTERKNAEERYRQVERIQAMGRLAGGIAHDFNNLLTAINGYSELIFAKLPADSKLRCDIEQVCKAGQRAALLTDQLLAFSRQQVRQTKVLDPNAVVADLDAMLRRLIGEDVELITLLAREIGHVEADPGQLEQVILNLTLNARDAMPDGGCLQIETRNVELRDDFVATRRGAKPGRHVLIEVRDNGTGMDNETRARIFEPFFTTKPDGRGTGLGLSTVHGIVEQGGGHIEVDSVPGLGTTFRLYLPHCDKADAVLGAEPQRRSTPCGNESIMVVEDEEAVRLYLVRILEELGYEVIEAAYGLEALDRFEKHEGEPIRLLITDVVMPKLGGRELALRLRERSRELKVVFISGYAGGGASLLDGFERDTAFLQKPFLPHVVAEAVREILDA